MFNGTVPDATVTSDRREVAKVLRMIHQFEDRELLVSMLGLDGKPIIPKGKGFRYR